MDTKLDTIKRLEGLQTVETVMSELHLTRQSAINFLSKLRKEQHCTVRGGGRRKRLYSITMRKQLPRQPGMWDILNKYNPNFQLNPWYDHQVHGKYTVEDVIVDAIEKKSFRICLATLRLFNHVKNWPYLYRKAKQHDCWQQVGALYDVARMVMKVRKMPEKYFFGKYSKKYLLDKKDTTKEERFFPIQRRWKVPIPFRWGDFLKLTG